MYYSYEENKVTSAVPNNYDRLEDWKVQHSNYVIQDDSLGSNIDELKFDGENVVAKTAEEILAARIPNEKIQLKQSCTMYQEGEFGVDTNFYAMLMHIQDMTDKPKCKAVLDETDALWQDYYIQKGKLEAGEEYSIDFSSHGKRPYSFAECREEIQSI